MSYRAYGKSVKSYTAWQSAHEYSLEDYCAPTVDNGFCYEATTGGTSDTDTETEPAVEPTWPNVPGQTVVDGSVVWTCREKEEEANPLSVTISLEDTGGYSLKDIWVTNDVVDGRSDFTIKGSYDNVNFRTLTGSPLQVAAASPTAHKGLQNAYPYIKVECLDTLISEIEIVAGQV